MRQIHKHKSEHIANTFTVVEKILLFSWVFFSIQRCCVQKLFLTQSKQFQYFFISIFDFIFWITRALNVATFMFSFQPKTTHKLSKD